MDKGKFLQVPGETESEMDKYTASIELSNACRQFYQSRLEAAHCIKSKWERHAHSTCCGDDSSNDNCRPADDHTGTSVSSQSQHRQRNSIDEAMDRLRTEMTSLMDQDLSLMKQLLTLNETIEELKWQRRYYYSRGSLPGSSTDLRHSDCSFSDTEMYESDDDSLHTAARENPHVTTSSKAASSRLMPLVVLTPSSSSSSSSSRQGTTKQGSEKKGVDCRVSEPSSVKLFHGEQDSFDSGFHEASSEEEAAGSC
ncbi:hypothetical protein ACOMHN_054085 [Nucella lapillus]